MTLSAYVDSFVSLRFRVQDWGSRGRDYHTGRQEGFFCNRGKAKPLCHHTRTITKELPERIPSGLKELLSAVGRNASLVMSEAMRPTSLSDQKHVLHADGKQIVVSFDDGLEGVPEQHRAEAAAQLQALERLARSALVIRGV